MTIAAGVCCSLLVIHHLFDLLAAQRRLPVCRLFTFHVSIVGDSNTSQLGTIHRCLHAILSFIVLYNRSLRDNPYDTQTIYLVQSGTMQF